MNCTHCHWVCSDGYYFERMRFLLLTLGFTVFSLHAQDCSFLAEKQLALEKEYDVLEQKLAAADDRAEKNAAADDRAEKKALRNAKIEIELSYADVSRELNVCIQSGGVIGDEVMPIDRNSAGTTEAEVRMSSSNVMEVDLFRQGVVKKSKGAIKVVIGTLVGVALAPVMLELAAVGAVIQVTGMVEIISGSMDVIESAN